MTEHVEGPRWVDITFDCVPLRMVTRSDPPLDASPGFLALWDRVQEAIRRFGRHNSYYLFNGQCTFHLTNNPSKGTLSFAFEGCLLTDSEDKVATAFDVHTTLRGDTCDWATEPIIRWFAESVREAVLVEFNHFIAHGDLEKTIQRLQKLEQEMEAKGGYVGFGL
ncbi:MAG TPA: hypothetical protein PLD05_08750 [Thermogutta sp.]|nr:hypothetical protein [Thermogutta sp.]HPU05649.1 hypothetical protein [Thermogutta sp.]